MSATPDQTPIAMFNGAPIPRGVTHYRVFREIDGMPPQGLSFGVCDGIEVAEWPIADLNPLTIRERWGSGKYHVRFVARYIDDKQRAKLRAASKSKVFTVVANAKGEASLAKAGAEAPPAFECCGGEWPKFCGVCGTAAAGVAAPPRAPDERPPIGGEFREGMAMAYSALREASAIAREESTRRIAEERMQFDQRMARERQQHELDIEYARTQRIRDIERSSGGVSASVDGDAIARVIAASLAPLTARIDELGQEIEEAREEASESVAEVKDSVVSQIVSTVKELSPVLGPLANAIVSKLTTAPTTVNGAGA